MQSALYPGQGSQHLGMGEFLYKNFDQSKKLFEEASDILHKDFKKLCFFSDEETLKNTIHTQPCLLLVSVASFLVLKNTLGLKFSYFAGHSVGEYPALVSAEVLSFSQALRAVQIRADNMAKAPKGAMTAVMGLDSAELIELCKIATKNTGGIVSLANINSPAQTVISGETKALTWIQENKNNLFVKKKWRAIALKVSSAFHSPLMKDTENVMTRHLQTIDFKEANAFVLPNAGPELLKNAKQLKDLLCKQICAPVQWLKTMKLLKKHSVNKCVEVGPAKVLSGLMKKTHPDIEVYLMNSLEDIKLIEKNFCK